MTANFPLKTWYVAATTAELNAAPLARRILGRDVVLWRTSGGRATALDDRCAHRGFPLSDGHVDGHQLVCGYHGCTYATDGTCIHVPTQPNVPTGMRVRAFPVLEEPPFVWVWMGPPRAAVDHRPPRTPWLTDPRWSTFTDAWCVQANYMMVHEHYLDFSYAPVLHAEDIPPGLERLPAFSDIEVTETTVAYTRQIPETPLAWWEADATGLDPAGRYLRRESGIFASPALHIQRWEIEADGRIYTSIRTDAITPETESTTRIITQVSYDYETTVDKTEMSLRKLSQRLRDRDTAILNKAAAREGYDGWKAGTDFKTDAAAWRARRIVAVMLDAEAGRSPLRPGRAKPGAIVNDAVT